MGQMQSDTKSRLSITGRSVYPPLDKAADEIRLLTIDTERVTPGKPLRCNLETVSLKDLRADYTSFIVSHDLSGQTPRQAKDTWASSHITAPQLDDPLALEDQGSDRFYRSLPQLNQYRFQWGDFAALSYVWGDTTTRRNIILNGAVVSITANLETALRTLAADRGTPFASRYKLWVDAICINQSDEQEKAQQIQRMRELYSTAWTVIAWIGVWPPGDLARHAVPFLRILASLREDQRDLQTLRTGRGEPSTGAYLCALHELMQQGYWFRLWIIQELVMGASSTVLRYGDDIMDWDTFLRGIGVLYDGFNWQFKDAELKRELRSRTVRHGRAWRPYSSHLVHFDLRQLSRAAEKGTRRLGFRRLLDIANGAKCSDVRDKVFGLVGMMDSAVAAEIMRAYGSDTPTLFAAVARAFIVHTNNLEPLRQGNPWGRGGAPSWAADWTWDGRMRFSRPEYNMVAPPWDPSEPEPDPDNTYRAHGGIAASYKFSNDARLLECEGFVFDEVVGIGAPEVGFFQWDKQRIRQYPSWRSAYGDLTATGQALWNTLLLSVVARGARAQQRHAALLSLPSSFRAALPQFESRGWDWLVGQKGYYFKWECWRDAHDDFMLGEQPLGSFFTNVIPKDADELTYIEIYCGSQRTVQQRRFMLTAKGYFGWGPDNLYDPDRSKALRVGDKIAIVYGCSTPLIIRPKGDKFEVVGEAYVQGFMDGEALGVVNSGGSRVQKFTFC